METKKMTGSELQEEKNGRESKMVESEICQMQLRDKFYGEWITEKTKTAESQNGREWNMSNAMDRQIWWRLNYEEAKTVESQKW